MPEEEWWVAISARRCLLLLLSSTHVVYISLGLVLAMEFSVLQEMVKPAWRRSDVGNWPLQRFLAGAIMLWVPVLGVRLAIIAAISWHKVKRNATRHCIPHIHYLRGRNRSVVGTVGTGGGGGSDHPNRGNPPCTASIPKFLRIVRGTRFIARTFDGCVWTIIWSCLVYRYATSFRAASNPANLPVTITPTQEKYLDAVTAVMVVWTVSHGAITALSRGFCRQFMFHLNYDAHECLQSLSVLSRLLTYLTLQKHHQFLVTPGFFERILLTLRTPAVRIPHEASFSYGPRNFYQPEDGETFPYLAAVQGERDYTELPKHPALRDWLEENTHYELQQRVLRTLQASAWSTEIAVEWLANTPLYEVLGSHAVGVGSKRGQLRLARYFHNTMNVFLNFRFLVNIFNESELRTLFKIFNGHPLVQAAESRAGTTGNGHANQHAIEHANGQAGVKGVLMIGSSSAGFSSGGLSSVAGAQRTTETATPYPGGVRRCESMLEDEQAREALEPLVQPVASYPRESPNYTRLQHLRRAYRRVGRHLSNEMLLESDLRISPCRAALPLPPVQFDLDRIVAGIQKFCASRDGVIRAYHSQLRLEMFVKRWLTAVVIAALSVSYSASIWRAGAATWSIVAALITCVSTLLGGGWPELVGAFMFIMICNTYRVGDKCALPGDLKVQPTKISLFHTTFTDSMGKICYVYNKVLGGMKIVNDTRATSMKFNISMKLDPATDEATMRGMELCVLKFLKQHPVQFSYKGCAFLISSIQPDAFIDIELKIASNRDRKHRNMLKMDQSALFFFLIRIADELNIAYRLPVQSFAFTNRRVSLS